MSNMKYLVPDPFDPSQMIEADSPLGDPFAPTSPNSPGPNEPNRERVGKRKSAR